MLSLEDLDIPNEDICIPVIMRAKRSSNYDLIFVGQMLGETFKQYMRGMIQAGTFFPLYKGFTVIRYKKETGSLDGLASITQELLAHMRRSRTFEIAFAEPDAVIYMNEKAYRLLMAKKDVGGQ